MIAFIKWLRDDGEVIPVFPWRTWIWMWLFMLNIGMTLGAIFRSVNEVMGSWNGMNGETRTETP